MTLIRLLSGFVCYNFHMLTISPSHTYLTADAIDTELIDPETALDIFRSSLPENDQQILHDLLVSASNYHTALKECEQCLPERVVLLAMLVEERKELLRLRQQFPG